MSRKFFLFGFVLAAVLLYFSFPAEAQTLSLNIQDQPSGSATARIFNLILLITVLSIAPSLLVMMTSFTRIVVVFRLRAARWRLTRRRRIWCCSRWLCS